MIWCIKIETENEGTIYVEGDTEKKKVDTIKEYLMTAKSITIDSYKDELHSVDLSKGEDEIINKMQNVENRLYRNYLLEIKESQENLKRIVGGLK